jgi:hypothetical protein
MVTKPKPKLTDQDLLTSAGGGLERPPTGAQFIARAKITGNPHPRDANVPGFEGMANPEESFEEMIQRLQSLRLGPSGLTTAQPWPPGMTIPMFDKFVPKQPGLPTELIPEIPIGAGFPIPITMRIPKIFPPIPQAEECVVEPTLMVSINHGTPKTEAPAYVGKAGLASQALNPLWVAWAKGGGAGPQPAKLVATTDPWNAIGAAAQNTIKPGGPFEAFVKLATTEDPQSKEFNTAQLAKMTSLDILGTVHAEMAGATFNAVGAGYSYPPDPFVAETDKVKPDTQEFAHTYVDAKTPLGTGIKAGEVKNAATEQITFSPAFAGGDEVTLFINAAVAARAYALTTMKATGDIDEPFTFLQQWKSRYEMRTGQVKDVKPEADAFTGVGTALRKVLDASAKVLADPDSKPPGKRQVLGRPGGSYNVGVTSRAAAWIGLPKDAGKVSPLFATDPALTSCTFDVGTVKTPRTQTRFEDNRWSVAYGESLIKTESGKNYILEARGSADVEVTSVEGGAASARASTSLIVIWVAKMVCVTKTGNRKTCLRIGAHTHTMGIARPVPEMLKSSASLIDALQTWLVDRGFVKDKTSFEAGGCAPLEPGRTDDSIRLSLRDFMLGSKPQTDPALPKDAGKPFIESKLKAPPTSDKLGNRVLEQLHRAFEIQTPDGVFVPKFTKYDSASPCPPK